MVKAGMIAVLGCFLAAPTPAAWAAETPAFVNATMCDVAAPLASGTEVFHRQIRAERTVRSPAARPTPGRRSEVRAGATSRSRRAPVSRPAPSEQAGAPAVEAAAVLRAAVHYCVTAKGVSNPIRHT